MVKKIQIDNNISITRTIKTRFNGVIDGTYRNSKYDRFFLVKDLDDMVDMLKQSNIEKVAIYIEEDNQIDMKGDKFPCMVFDSDEISELKINE